MTYLVDRTFWGRWMDISTLKENPKKWNFFSNDREHFYIAHKHQCVHIIKTVFVTKIFLNRNHVVTDELGGYYMDSTFNSTIFIQLGKSSFSYFIFVFMT